jgi:nucleotide-binding universal stress UspA family protein
VGIPADDTCARARMAESKSLDGLLDEVWDMAKKFLLLLDGSAAASRAAQTAWMLTETTKAELTALHVIDTDAVRRLVKVTEPGLVGSGVYLTVYDEVAQAMRNLGETVAAAYAAHADGQLSGHNKVVVEEGSPHEVLLTNLNSNDMLILGHRKPEEKVGETDSISDLYKTALQESNRPVLFVHEFVPELSTVRVIVGKDLFSQSALVQLSEFAQALKAKLEIYCVGHERQLDKLFARLKELVQSLPKENQDVSILMRNVDDLGGAWKPDMAVSKGMLPVFLTFPDEAGRRTSVGTDPEEVVSKLKVPSLMFFPTERPSPVSAR